MEFRTDSIFEALKSPLALVNNDERRVQLEQYVEAARLPLERSVFDLLSSFGDAVNERVAPRYQVALSYRPGALELDVRAQTQEEPEAPEQVWTLAEGEVEKITLRLPGELKELATEAAAKAGLSVNSWFVRVLARALRNAEGADEPPTDWRRHRRRGRHDESPPGIGRKLTGWVGPES